MVDAYLSDDIASDSNDEKKIRQAQARAAASRKKTVAKTVIRTRPAPYQRRQNAGVECRASSYSDDFFSWLWELQ